MKEELCKRLLNSEDLRWIAKQVGRDKADDMIQEVALTICEKSESYLKKIENFEYWAARIMFNFASKTGKSRKYSERNAQEYAPFEMMEDEYDVELDKTLYCAVDSLYWYDRELIKEHYFESKSMRQISRETGIPVNSISYAINNAKDELKKKIDC